LKTWGGGDRFVPPQKERKKGGGDLELAQEKKKTAHEECPNRE